MDAYLAYKLAGVLVFAWLGILALKEQPPQYSKFRAFSIVLLAIAAGYFGSKFWYIFQHIWGSEPYDTSDRVAMFDAAGSVLYGWIFGGAAAVFLFSKIENSSPLKNFDALAPGLLIAQALNRFGCFAGQCCWGRPSSVEWAIWNENARALVHPVQLYEAAVDIVLLILVYAQPNERPGRRTFVYFTGYAVARFILERFRGDNQPAWQGLTVPQIASLAVLATVFLVFIFLRRRRPL